MKIGRAVAKKCHADGVEIRVWVYSERESIETVCDVWLTPTEVAELVVGIEREQERTDQYQLTFDD